MGLVSYTRKTLSPRGRGQGEGHVAAEWSPDLSRITAPGLALWGAGDPYDRDPIRRAARRAFRLPPRLPHWWQLERPDAVAAHIRTLWVHAG